MAAISTPAGSNPTGNKNSLTDKNFYLDKGVPGAMAGSVAGSTPMSMLKSALIGISSAVITAVLLSAIVVPGAWGATVAIVIIGSSILAILVMLKRRREKQEEKAALLQRTSNAHNDNVAKPKKK